MPPLNVSLETLGLDLQLVVTDWQLQQDVSSSTICHRGTGQAGFGLLSVYRRALHHTAARIQHCAADTSRDLLRRCARASKHSHRQDTPQPYEIPHAILRFPLDNFLNVGADESAIRSRCANL